MATQRHARHALPSRSTWSILRTQFHKASLKEESDFRNERDVVPAAIRAGPNRRFFFLFFLERWYPATRRRGREFLEFLSFFSCFVCFPWELVSGRGVFL